MNNVVLAKYDLSNLIKYISKNPIPISDKDWGGADVLISSKKLSKKKSMEWLEAGKILVVTKYSKELSWLFMELRDIHYKHCIIDYASKYGFFGRLGDAAIHSIQKHGDNKDKMLNDVLSEALLMLEEIIPSQQLFN